MSLKYQGTIQPRLLRSKATILETKPNHYYMTTCAAASNTHHHIQISPPTFPPFSHSLLPSIPINTSNRSHERMYLSSYHAPAPPLTTPHPDRRMGIWQAHDACGATAQTPALAGKNTTGTRSRAHEVGEPGKEIDSGD